jgi:alpha-L-fucosidase 2
MTKHFLPVMAALLITSLTMQGAKSEPLKLWYDKPATDWMTGALPIGNAYMGAMIFGGTDTEEIQFNEETLWEGGPNNNSDYNFGIRKDAASHLPVISEMLKNGDIKGADQTAKRNLTGIIHPMEGQDFGDFGSFQNFGSVKIVTANSGTITNYYRDLNISEATATVAYTAGKTKHQRTYFASYPKKLLVFRITNSNPKGVDYKISMEIPHQNIKHSFDGKTLTSTGNVKGNLLNLESRMRIDTDGTIALDNNSLDIKSARQITIYLTAATDYANMFPTYRGEAPSAKNGRTMEAMAEMSYQALKAEHLKDYKTLFDRVSISLGSNNNLKGIPTDKRLENYAKGSEDPALEALYFQLARYYMISSSRPGSMPATLQGKWNNSNMPPWACDYHTNINLQMIYWATEVGNLPECHLPLAEYIKSLQTPGEKTTKAFFDMPGWTVNTMNNAFGYTAPGWGLPWGFFPGGAAWLCRHIWEHYEYTQDKEFLKRMMPTLTESVRFWHHYLTADSEGKLSSSPSYSPEHGEISTGATMDHQIVWDLYSNYLKACNILNISNEFTSKTEADLKALYPLKIGRWGQLQEWKEDVDDPKSTHRHVSHLYGLYPGYQITPEATPELAAASKISLDARGDGGTGWSLAWKINFRARLKDGNHAHKMLQNLLKPVGSSGSGFDNSGGTYPNLFCAHPPFQLDGNMGGAAGIAEMLLQSHLNEIELLPALPDTWLKGEVKGLKARGNHTVDINWNSGKLTSAMIKSPAEGKVKVRYGAKTIEVDVKANKAVKISEANFR